MDGVLSDNNEKTTIVALLLMSRFQLLIAVPFLVERALILNDGWIAYGLEYVLIGIFFMWLVTLPP